MAEIREKLQKLKKHPVYTSKQYIKINSQTTS